MIIIVTPTESEARELDSTMDLYGYDGEEVIGIVVSYDYLRKYPVVSIHDPKVLLVLTDLNEPPEDIINILAPLALAYTPETITICGPR